MKNCGSSSNVPEEEDEVEEEEVEEKKGKTGGGGKNRSSPTTSAARRILMLAMKCEWGGMEQGLKPLENSYLATKNSASASPSRAPLAGIVDEVISMNLTNQISLRSTEIDRD